MKTILISVAMNAEYELLCGAFDDAKEIEIKGIKLCKASSSNKCIIIAKSGIGKVNAAMAVTLLIDEFAPDYVVSTGVAGGLQSSVDTGDIVAGSAICYHDVYLGKEVVEKENTITGRFATDKKLIESISSLQTEFPQIKLGLICTGDQFIDSVGMMQAIVDKIPDAMAVDMEGCAIAQVCKHFGIPFLPLRIISDTPYRQNNAEQFKEFFTQAPQMLFKLVRRVITEMKG